MSYDVYFEIDTGAGNEVEVARRTYTRNVSPMWAEALGENLGDLITNQSAAVKLEPFIRVGITDMVARPAIYREMNPENGWGDYEGALAYLEWIAEMAQAHPNCRVEVWR